jgi:hypothetical protein
VVVARVEAVGNVSIVAMIVLPWFEARWKKAYLTSSAHDSRTSSTGMAMKLLK